jgi:DNA-binding FadR family transcriptional regulator
VAVDSARPRLTPIHVPKASDVLAEELRERILRGEYPVDTVLPSERSLVAQTRLSRTTVHEALRILEIQGLLELRTGRSGGAYVRSLGQDWVASSVSLLIRARQIEMVRLLEALVAMEPSCAAMAARHRSVADLDQLECANDRLAAFHSLEDFLAANVDWHATVARASGNEILGGFLQALSSSIYVAAHYQGFVDDGLRRVTEQAHRAITAAIRDRDPDAAHRRMARHVHAYAEAMH